MSLSLKPFIAGLCLFAGLLVLALAPPSRRMVVGLVVVLPFVVGAVVALRGYAVDRAQAKRLSDSESARALVSLVPDVDAFIREAPALAAGFRSRAARILGSEPVSLGALEDFARKHAESMDLSGPEFLQWVAAYGEALRRSSRGRWSKALVLRRGEPVVVSGRFPFLRRAVLLEAYQALESASDFRHGGLPAREDG